MIDHCRLGWIRCATRYSAIPRSSAALETRQALASQLMGRETPLLRDQLLRLTSPWLREPHSRPRLRRSLIPSTRAAALSPSSTQPAPISCTRAICAETQDLTRHSP